MKLEILVADDEPGFRALFRYLLEPRGYNVSTANDGAEALEKAQHHDYGLIFLDVHMPKMTGPEVLRRLRKTNPIQPVVILSSSATPELVSEESKMLGATACFQKPFDTKDIFQVIDDVLGVSTKSPLSSDPL